MPRYNSKKPREDRAAFRDSDFYYDVVRRTIPGSLASYIINKWGNDIWEPRRLEVEIMTSLLVKPGGATAGEPFSGSKGGGTLSFAISLSDWLLGRLARGDIDGSIFPDPASATGYRQISAICVRLAIKMNEDSGESIQLANLCDAFDLTVGGLKGLEIEVCKVFQWDLYGMFKLTPLYALDQLRMDLPEVFARDGRIAPVAEYLLLVSHCYPCYIGMDVKCLAMIGVNAALRILELPWGRHAVESWASHELVASTGVLIRIATRTAHPAASHFSPMSSQLVGSSSRHLWSTG
ncbi:hypothetical protein HDU87_003869 [Geranomyces variabilis]|uniref:Uncharacterized protein n=1 Tax=Geranomyces variabilis TaxID=109894 RepID=A0AAD5XSC1_9FUNG|nr:hypothetical protein HDU87_003869 [Geranomyces variabilis]